MKNKIKKVWRNAENLDPNLKLRIKDIPIANARLIREVASVKNRNIGEVEEIINFMGSYTANVIKEGVMETVMLPYFGKFTPNMKSLQGKVHRIRSIRDKTLLFELAMKGKNINFIPQINPITYDHGNIKEDRQQDSDLPQ